MGLEKSQGRRIFVNIKKGVLTIKKDGITETYGSISGMLTGIEITQREYLGQPYEQLSLFIMDGNETFELQMRFDSGYGRGFCYSIKNADVTRRIKFAPSYKEKEGKGESWLFLEQAGQWLPRYFSKDVPNGLPPMKKTTFKGKDMWDNTDQLVFWKQMIEEVKTKLPHPAIAQSDADDHSAKANIPEASEIAEPVDDLPF